MPSIPIYHESGVIIRKAALQAKNISRETLLQVMEAEDPLAEDQHLISFGPHFGGEAASEFLRRLETIGLRDDQDMFEFADELPEWLQLTVIINEIGSAD